MIGVEYYFELASPGHMVFVTSLTNAIVRINVFYESIHHVNQASGMAMQGLILSKAPNNFKQSKIHALYLVALSLCTINL